MRIVIAALLFSLAVDGAAQQVVSQREAIVLAEDRRASDPGDYERLVASASRGSAATRALAIRALGRLEQRHPSFETTADLIQRALADRNAHIRRTAAYALAQSVVARDAAARAPRRTALLAALAAEKEEAVAAALMESAARLADVSSIAEVEAAVIARAGARPRATGVTSALEILSRRAGRDGRLGEPSIAWLKTAVVATTASAEARREALAALLASNAVDDALAATLLANGDWQVRRLALLSKEGTAPSNLEPSNLIEKALADPAPQVRLEAIRLFARHMMRARGCDAAVAALKDTDTHVALAAIDALSGCPEGHTESAVAALEALAATPGTAEWHRASHALVTLASLDQAKARSLAPAHLADGGWPVRMYAARAAAVLRDDEMLETLMGDAHPNVREAALAGLAARATGAVIPGFPADLQPARRARLGRAVAAALTDLRDPQLILTAATAVKETREPAALKDAILQAIAALDAKGSDTTVDARVALVEALKVAAPGVAAPAALAALAPETPSVQELRALPVRARIEMARGGAFEIAFLPDEAPATIARFARLARAGYFDGLTFHRVVPNFVVQGGSPWANEYAGAPRFQRDELGFARHERGALGISTRGRDTGDAQIFIDLVDLPRLNHDYTVFARVVSGLDVVDGILEADVIQRISILK
ncbi:MAG: peptidylprolyl isomerase [Acidobacteriota bacterium]|nr:peptidylprolyl isomerase [Acidobacteriota bacterium]